MTRAQRKAVDRLKKKHGTILHDGVERDGESIRVHWLGDDPLEDRIRVISPTGLAQEPADVERLP